MKVFFINTIDKSGSTGRIVRQLGQVVEQNGGEYMVAFGRGSETDKHAYRIGNDLEFYAHAAFSRITDRAGFYSRHATKKLIEKIREFHPDVIHMHNLHGYYVHLPTLFSYLKEEFTGKVIWTLHDCWAFTGHCVHYTYAKCDKWQSACGDCPEKHRYPESLLMDRSEKNYMQKKKVMAGIPNMTIVTPSAWLAEQVRSSFLKEYPIAVIHNGIDLEQFRITDVPREKVILNVVDGLDDRKGYPDLLELSKKLPLEYKIVMVGASESECEKAPESIVAIPRTSNILELVEWYNKAKCLINPTYEDTFPTVNLEALACGTPVITYKAGGSPESVTEECGIVVPVGDVDGLCKAIMECNFSAEACRRCAEKYSIAAYSAQYMALYQKND